MKLEIKDIYPIDPLEDPEEFLVPLEVDIGEPGKPGAERFHFVAVSASGLQHQVTGRDFRLLRGYILMETFDMAVVRQAIENLLDQARSAQNWNEVVDLLSRYGRYDSEGL